MSYSEPEIERIARVAFPLAQTRRRRLLSIDKSNVLECSRLWREVVTRVARDFPDVQLSHMYVDSAAMSLVLRPTEFDVILTENMFGDILSDQAGGIVGSLGLLASASIGGPVGLYEPVHGSAPDIAGQNVANPLGAILSVALMLRHTFHLPREAECVEAGVISTLMGGFRTRDLARPGERTVSTEEMGAQIAEFVHLAATPNNRAASCNRCFPACRDGACPVCFCPADGRRGKPRLYRKVTEIAENSLRLPTASAAPRHCSFPQAGTPRLSHTTGCAKLPRTFAARPGKDAAACPRSAPTPPEPLRRAVPRASPETESPDRIPSVQFSAEEKCVAPRPAGTL